MVWGSGGSKSRLAKAAGAQPAGQMRDEKLHAVVARSKFRSQNVQNTPAPDHFWKLRCRKSGCCCGAKHISKSKCTKHLSFGAILEVALSKKSTPLWREAHFEVKMYKTHHVRTTFGSWDVEKVHAVVARSTFRSQNVKNTRGLGPLLDVQISFRVAGARVCAPGQKWAKCEDFVATTTTPHFTPIHYTTTTPSLHFTTLHSTTLHCTTLQLHSITLNYTTLHYTSLRYTTFHYTTLHYTTPHSTTLHYTAFHYTTLNYTTLHSITLHHTTLHNTTLHSTTLQLQLPLQLQLQLQYIR